MIDITPTQIWYRSYPFACLELEATKLPRKNRSEMCLSLRNPTWDSYFRCVDSFRIYSAAAKTKFDSNISPIPLLIFTGVKKCEIWSQFSNDATRALGAPNIDLSSLHIWGRSLPNSALRNESYVHNARWKSPGKYVHSSTIHAAVWLCWSLIHRCTLGCRTRPGVKIHLRWNASWTTTPKLDIFKSQ